VTAPLSERYRHSITPPGNPQTAAYNAATTMPSASNSVMNGIIIGLLSSFGSAILIALIFLIVYFFRYTASGRIFLDRIGRPGEYDDEQAFAKEEAEALESMDDMQRTEYLRAKGIYMPFNFPNFPTPGCCETHALKHRY
jgi:hypothetical protein